MFNKVATSKMLQPGRPARSVNASANDNRRNVRPSISARARAPRLVCRWSLSPSTGRPVCRWELDNVAEPSSPWRDASLGSLPFHKTVFQRSYPKETVGATLHDPGRLSGADAGRRVHIWSSVRKVLHARHSPMRSSDLPDPAPSHRERFALGLVANDLQLEQ
jgi:hypothetical protein